MTQTSLEPVPARPHAWRDRDWRRQPSVDAVLRLLREKRALIGGGIVGLFILVAAFAPLLAPYDPLETRPAEALKSFSWEHPLGTDQSGRDVLSRMIYGTRVSLLVGVIAVGLAGSVGIPLGLVAGYFGGILDHVIMRIMDGIVAFPGLILALGIVATLGPGVRNVMLAVAFGSVPAYARLVRSQSLSLRTSDYVTAARALGANDARIVVRHVWPQVVSPVIVLASLGMGSAILAEAGLSFLGVGVKPPTPTWGSMLQQGFPLVYRSIWLPIIPGIAIFVLVLGLNFLGDALRDVLDPRLRGRR